MGKIFFFMHLKFEFLQSLSKSRKILVYLLPICIIIDRVHYQIVYSVYEQGSETFDIAQRTQKSPDRGTLNNIKLKILCITVTWQTNQLTFAASLAAILYYNRFAHSFMSINYRQLFA